MRGAGNDHADVFCLNRSKGVGPNGGSHNCGGDHYVIEFPQTQKGGKSKGKGGYMPPKQWSDYNPGIFRPNQWRDWRPGKGKGKSKGINGMMMENGGDAFPPVLGAMTNDYGYYESQTDYDGWGNQE